MKSLLTFLALLTFLLLPLLAGEVVFARPQPKQHKKFLGFPDGTWGVGAVLGEPTGLRGTYFTDWKHAFQVTPAYSWSKVYQLNADYLFYLYNQNDRLRSQDFWNSLFFYIGPGLIGGLYADDNSFQAGLRAVGGVEYLFERSNWAVRLEVAGNGFVVGKTGFGGQAIVGFTYYMYPARKSKFEEFQKSSPDEDVDTTEFE